MNSKHIFLLGLSLILAGCSSQISPNTPSPIPSESPPPTVRVTQPPTASRPPTKTPRPSPTLPVLESAACIPTSTDRVTALVSNVIDGDTIEVSIQGLRFRVRYLGMDTPEITPDERMGPEATKRNRELVRGKRVTLIRDSLADNMDRFDRLLRYVIVDDLFVNHQLVREGLAHYTTFPNTCSKMFFEAESEARGDKIGLWAP